MSGPRVARALPADMRATDLRLYNMQQQLIAMMNAMCVAVPTSELIEPGPLQSEIPVPVPVDEPTPVIRQRPVLLD